MAERYAIQNGPWSAPSTWDGGALPGVGDTVHAGGFDVLIDQSVEVDALSLAAGDSAPAGGRFHVDDTVTAPVTIDLALGIRDFHHQSGNASNNARTYILWVEDGAPHVTLNAPVIFAGNGSYRNAVGVLVTGAASAGEGEATVTINAPHETGITGSGNNAVGLRVDGGTVDITGDITGGSGNSAYGLRVDGGTVDITGDVTGGGSNAYGLRVGGGTVDITGDITGGSGGTAYGLRVDGGTVDITGDITGGSSAYGLYATGGTVDITGDVTGGSGGTAYGLYVDGALALVRVDGTIYASEDTNGLSVTSAPNLPPAIKRAVNHQNGMSAVYAAKFIIWEADDFTWEAYSDAAWPDPQGSKITLSKWGSDLPYAGDVREGVTYGPGGSITGTLRVDGSAPSLSLKDVATVTGAQIAAATNHDD